MVTSSHGNLYLVLGSVDLGVIAMKNYSTLQRGQESYDDLPYTKYFFRNGSLNGLFRTQLAIVNPETG